MSKVLLLTGSTDSAAQILPSLSLLDHTVRLAPAAAAGLGGSPPKTSTAAGLGGSPLQASTAGGSGGSPPQASTASPVRGAFDSNHGQSAPDVVLVDARRDLVRVSQLVRRLSGTSVPLLVIISEGAWAAVSADWGADVILHSAGPDEVEARIRLAIGRVALATTTPAGPSDGDPGEVRSGELCIDEATYSARIGGVALDLTFKEFELIKFLAQHPRRVFTRAQLLQEVWGYDYFGGTRTVDVHVRRLRAKLGVENEDLIGTVRNVGYKFVPAKVASPRREASTREASTREASTREASTREASTREASTDMART